MNDIKIMAERFKVMAERYLELAKETGQPQVLSHQGQPTIPYLPADSFDWSRWRAFTLFEDMAIPHRTLSLVSNKARFKEKAIGYCRGDELSCRPKFGTYAVMFIHNDEWQWCHLTSLEFHAIFYGA
jgi:hypothetical protein